jgi:sporulation protein YlmC with PRC-barrel domain
MAGEEKSTTIKIILLQEPKEAKFRKIPVQNTIPYRGSDTIKDKLVIDARGTALGCVDSLVLFRNTPGIRIYALKPSDSISLTFLSRYLEKIGRPDIKDELAKYFQSDTGYHVYKAKMSDVEEFMRKTNLSFRVPEEVLVDHGVREFVMDIPWDIVQKIGDVVLLKETLSDIRSKGF